MWPSRISGFLGMITFCAAAMGIVVSPGKQQDVTGNNQQVSKNAAAQRNPGRGLSPVVRKSIAAAVPLMVLAIIWVSPTPAGLTVQAWRMLAIFAATIIALLFQPLPSGALMFIALAFSIVTKVLTESKALVGFTNSTVWLIFCAYIISIGFMKTGLGKRIAYKMISWLGGSTLGIAYALGLSDLVLAPAMPSVTARSGGVIFPIVRSITSICGSEPGPTGKKLGNFLILSSFLITPVTGAMFLTGMAANPLAAELAKKTLKIEITWGGWALAALVPGLLCFIVTPLLVYWLTKPELKRAPGARDMAERGLQEMGPMSRKEQVLTAVFFLTLIGWATGTMTQLGATTVALAGVALLFLFGVVQWKDLLAQGSAWDTLIWFGAIMSLATGLGDLGFIKWMAVKLSAAFLGWPWVTAFIGLGLVYIYIHYAFATATGHTAALYAPFLAAAVAAGAPPMMAAITFGIFSNLMWGITEYGGGPNPIYFSLGYFERPKFYALNFIVTTVNVLITFAVGMVWWRVIGLW
jgi:DASS family divalent anion:Na+ symporter